MDINRGAHQDLRYPVARFNEKGCLLVWGGDALMLYFGTQCPNCSKFSWVLVQNTEKESNAHITSIDIETLSGINEHLPIHLTMIAELQTQIRSNVPIPAASEFYCNQNIYIERGRYWNKFT